MSITAPLPHGDDAVPTRSLDISSQEEEMIEVTPHAEGSSPRNELPDMLAAIQALRAEFDDATSASPRIAVEINTSCPNIEGHPPPSYDISSLRPLVKSVAEVCSADPSLAVGIKLPPYVYARQFVDVIDFIASFTEEVGGKKRNPIAFLTCTNTLGSSLMFGDQVIKEDQAVAEAAGGFALPATWGGLAGESLHPLSLGCVKGFLGLMPRSDPYGILSQKRPCIPQAYRCPPRRGDPLPRHNRRWRRCFCRSCRQNVPSRS